MPQTKNPGLISSGPGTIPPKAVGDVSLKNPNRDVETLNGHRLDPRRAHMATAIAIVDAGGFFASDNVEGALQEVVGGVSAGRSNGLTSGGTWTSAGRIVTLDIPTTIVLNGAFASYGGTQVTLPAPAGTYNVYIASSTGVLTASNVLPSLVLEPIWIAEITHDGTNVVSSIDARFFVANIDRKLDYTVRSDNPLDADNEVSEACFISLEAAFFWFEKYGGSSEKKNTLIVRGTHALTSTLAVPVDNITVRGEGGAQIVFGPATDLHVFDLGTTSGFTIENIEFVCDAGTGLSIPFYSSGTTSELTVKNCTFSSGSEAWLTVASLGLNGQNIVENCIATTESSGFNLNLAGGSLFLSQLDLTGTATAMTSSSGIRVSPDNTQNITMVVSDCTVRNYHTGVNDLSGGGLGFIDGFTIENCVISEVVQGVISSTGTSFAKVVNTLVTTDATVGLYGVYLSGDKALVSGCSFVSPRDPTTYVNTQIPSAVRLIGSDCRVIGCYAENFVNTTGRGAAVNSVGNGLTVEGCHFLNSQILGFDLAIAGRSRISITNNRMYGDGFAALTRSVVEIFGPDEVVISGNTINCNTSGATGMGYTYGVFISGGAQTIYNALTLTGTSHNVVVSNNTITAPITAGIGIATGVDGYVLQGNSVDGYLSADPLDPTAYGIRIASSGSPSKDGRISGNRLTRCKYGVVVEGTSSNPVLNLGISDNTISFCAVSLALADTFFGRGAAGIAAEYCQGLVVSNNTLRNIGEIIDDSGSYGFPGVAATSSNGILIWNSPDTIITGNSITSPTSSNGGEIHGIRYEHFLVGAASSFENVGVLGNSFDFTSTGRGTDNGISGVEVRVEGAVGAVHALVGLTVSNNQVYSVSKNILDRGIDVAVEDYASLSSVLIEGNTVRNYTLSGISNRVTFLDSFLDGTSIVGNSVYGGKDTTADADSGGVLLDTSTAGTYIYGANISNNSLDDMGPNGILVKYGPVAVGPATGIVQGLSITGNMIDSVVSDSGDASAIYLYTLGAPISNVDIVGNQIYQGISAPSYVPKYGVLIFGEGEVTQLYRIGITGNKITSTDNGIILSSAASSVFVDGIFDSVRIDGNTILQSGSNVYAGLEIFADQCYLEKFSFSNNFIETDAGGDGVCVKVDCSSALVSSNPNIMVDMCGNQGKYSKYGMQLELYGDLTQTHLDGNTFLALGAAPANAIYLKTDYLSYGSVSKNHCLGGISVEAPSSETIDLKIENNIVSYLTADAPGIVTGISFSSGTSERVSVSGNSLETDQDHTIGISFTSTSAVNQIKVDDNIVKGVHSNGAWGSGDNGYGIIVSFGTGVTNVSVCGNLIQTDTSDFMHNGIVVSRLSSPTSPFTWEIVDVSRNKVYAKVLAAGESNPFSPAGIYFGDVSGFVGDELTINRFTFSHNTLLGGGTGSGVFCCNAELTSTTWKVIGNSSENFTSDVRTIAVAPVNSINSLNIAQAVADWGSIGWVGGTWVVANNVSY